MNPFKWLWQLFARSTTLYPPNPTLGGGDVLSSLQKGKCPDCGHDEFFKGPQGGMCTNIKCANDKCGSEFNVSEFGGPIFYAERI